MTRILITAGPTREYIDDIRFITNSSTGIMGLSLAEEAVNRGYNVTVVLGPTNITPVYGVKVIPVVSSDEMIEKSLLELRHGYDVLISAAAIGDYTPTKRYRGKLSSRKEVTIKLKPTRKLIREARKIFPKLKIVAFKAVYNISTEDMIAEARKLMDYADMVVANDVSKGVFGSPDIDAHIVCDDVKCIPHTSKNEASKVILDALESMLISSGK